MANTISARDDAWRSIDIDKYDPDSAVNFNMAAFTPGIEPVSAGEVQSLIGQIRVPLRTGNAAAALRQALENVPYGADEKSKVLSSGSTITITIFITVISLTALLLTPSPPYRKLTSPSCSRSSRRPDKPTC